MNEGNAVAVIDNDDAVHQDLRLMLEPLSIMVQAYANVQEFLEDPCSRECGCLVLDVRMPGISGIDLQRRLIESGWHIPVIFVTAHGDVPHAVEAMRLGAADFLQKPVNEQQLIDSIQRALERSKERRRQRRVTDVIAARVACLTPRELEVLELLIKSRRSKDIAQALGVSLKTVDEYRGNVLRKMHVASTTELLVELSRGLPDIERRRQPSCAISLHCAGSQNSAPAGTGQRSSF